MDHGQSMGNAKSKNSGIDMSEATDFVKDEITKEKVVIFSKSYCPYCMSTKNLFKWKKVHAKVFELDRMSNGSAVQGALASLTGQRTVPSVFINGKHLGGNDDTQRASSSGQLDQMLA